MAKKESVIPLGLRLLVKPDEPETQTRGGILLPDVAKKKAGRGRVVAIGGGELTKGGVNRPVSVKVGDTVLYGGWAGATADAPELEGHLVIHDNDILAKLEE